jgi:hypothetical protein
MSLCTTGPPTAVGRSVKINIHVEDNTNVPQISNDCGAYLAIHNYSIQRFITRSLKFITSYYDFVGGQINSTVNSTNVNSVYQECCDGDSNVTIPSPAYPSTVKDRVFQAWQWVWSRLESLDSFDLFCEPDCLLQPVLTLITLSGGESSANFRNSLLKSSLSNITSGHYVNQTNCGAFCDSEDCAVTVGTQGCGKDYNNAQFFSWCSEVVGVIEIMENILDSLDLKNDPLNAEQLLHKICDCYIKCACCEPKANQPSNTCDLTVLHCYNRAGEPYSGRKVTTSDTSTAEIVKNTYGGCESVLDQNDKYRPQDLSSNLGNGHQLGFTHESDSEECCLPGSINSDHQYDGKLFIPSTKERLQAAIFVLDWLAYLLFDRDADPEHFSGTQATSNNCYCPGWEGEADGDQSWSDVSWLKRRCKLGTGNGNCVVAAGACAGFRVQDDFQTLNTTLASVKFFFQQLGTPHDEAYQNNVTDQYNHLVEKLHEIHLGENELNIHVDQAAPQFCCTTRWTQAGRQLAGARGLASQSPNPCACCNLTIPEYTVQCFARMKCSCLGPLCKQCPPKEDYCEPTKVQIVQDSACH